MKAFKHYSIATLLLLVCLLIGGGMIASYINIKSAVKQEMAERWMR
jgi:hypothetical protein